MTMLNIPDDKTKLPIIYQQPNGVEKVITDRMSRIADAIEWSQICLREANKDFFDRGRQHAQETVQEIVNELTRIRSDIWKLIQPNKWLSGDPAPFLGEFPEYADSVDDEIRAWVDARIVEIKNIIRETVGLVEQRGDFDEFPCRKFIAPDWTRFNSQKQNTLPNCTVIER